MKRFTHILLFVLTVFVMIPVLCESVFADIGSIESVSDNNMDPKSLETDDITHAAHIYINKPEPSAALSVEGGEGLTFALPPLWWRPPMRASV